MGVWCSRRDAENGQVPLLNISKHEAMTIETNDTIGASIPHSPTRKRPRTPVALALSDLAEGTNQWWMWKAMAWQDILQRYRGSVLGPFWLTLSMAIAIAALGTLYSKLFHMDISTYLPYLCLGLVVWTLISSIVLDGCLTFTAAQMVRQIKLPYTVHAYRVVCRNLIIAAHNLVVYAGVVLLFDITLSAVSLIALLGVLLIIINGFWVSILLGMVCSRFRDVPQIIASVIQVIFFVTPILWSPDLLANRIGFALWNPLFGFIDLIRAPLLNQFPHPTSWITTLLVTVIGSVVTFFFFARFRARIPYWA